MAAVDWPWALATVEWSGYARTSDPNVRRTELEDGAVRQVKRVSRPFEVRTITVSVKQSNLDAFNDWLRTNANDFFNWHDIEDDTVRDARIRGGAGAVSLVAVAGDRLGDERFFRGTLQLEGYWT